jgi:hypothetical protein
MRGKGSRLPASVDNLGTVLLTLLEERHRFVFRDIDSVDITTGLNAEARAGAPGGYISNSRDVDVFTSVELECWLSRVDFQVDLAFWVIERCQLL